MSFIDWKEEYTVGVEYLDGQHQKLFKMINDYYDSMRSEAGIAELAKFLKGLEDYAFIHFTSEERNMSLYHFDGYEAHKKEHSAFTDYVEGKLTDIKEGRSVFGIEITNYIKEWLVTHVLGTDRLYTSTFQAHGLK